MIKQIRVVLVDDQQLVRAGFAMVINSQPDMHVVGEAGDGAQALRLLGTIACDIVLMDVRMPNLDGLGATEKIATGAIAPAGGDAPRIIMLTTFDLDEYLLAAIRAGASGFLLKDAPPEEMLGAIRTVYSGDAVIAPSSTRHLIDYIAGEVPPLPEQDVDYFANLTEREREVLVLMAQGLSNIEIGQALFVAEATVKTHVGRILAKLQTRDRVQAVVAAYEHGLARPGERRQQNCD